MDPFSLLVLVGLAVVGAGGLAFLALGMTWIILWAILVIAVAIGLIDDYRYNKLVAAGKAPYRLPFPWRLRGWQVGSAREPGYKNSFIFDRARNKLVPIVRKV